MTNKVKNILFVVAGVIVGLLFATMFGGSNVGGVYSNVIKDFSDGISVDGTVVIDGSGNIDAPITSSTGTFSSTLAVTGASTFASGVTISGELATLETSEAVTTTNVLTKAESFSTYYLSGATATTTLPAVATATSAVFRFVVSGAVSGDLHIASAEGTNIEGALIVAGAVVECDAVSRINIIADGENLGDFVELRSDGQKWFIGASGALTASKMTCSADI